MNSFKIILQIIGLFWSLEDNIFKWSSASCIYRHEKTMFVWNRGSGYEVGEYLDKQFVYDLEKWRDKTLYQYFGDSIESKEMKLSFGFIRDPANNNDIPSDLVHLIHSIICVETVAI
eukprot:158750_1